MPSGSKGPQARTADELDSFGQIYEIGDSADAIRAAHAFLRSYPESEFAEYVRMVAMHAYGELADWKHSDEMARAVLKSNAENVDALFQRARLLVEDGHETPQNVAEATALAQTGLDLVNRMRLPPLARSREWLRTKKSFLAAGMSVLGWCWFRTGSNGKALELMTKAADFDPQGEYFYKLALITADMGNPEDSLKHAVRARESGPPPISALAERHIAKLKGANGKH